MSEPVACRHGACVHHDASGSGYHWPLAAVSIRMESDGPHGGLAWAGVHHGDHAATMCAQTIQSTSFHGRFCRPVQAELSKLELKLPEI